MPSPPDPPSGIGTRLKWRRGVWGGRHCSPNSVFVLRATKKRGKTPLFTRRPGKAAALAALLFEDEIPADIIGWLPRLGNDRERRATAATQIVEEPDEVV